MYPQPLASGPVVHVRRHRGVDVAGKWLADGQSPMVVGVPGFPRGRVCAQSNEGDETNLLVVAPPPNGRRSLAGGETERQSSRAYDAGHARGCNRASYAC